MAYINTTGNPDWDVVQAKTVSGNTNLKFRNGEELKYDPKKWTVKVENNLARLEPIVLGDEFVTLPT